MDREQVVKMFEEARDDEHTVFVGKQANDKLLSFIEMELDVVLPPDYKWYLREYGYVLVSGGDIIGTGKTDVPKVIRVTKDWREHGLPKQFVVVEEYDEFLYCLDTRDVNEAGDCSVLLYEWQWGESTKRFESFYEYLAYVISGREIWPESWGNW